MTTKTPSLAVPGAPIPRTLAPRTLADVIGCLQQCPTLPTQRRHDLTSAVRAVARLLERPAADLAADPAAIRQRLAPFTAASAGLSERRWRNVRALLTGALTLAGVHVMRRRRAPLAPHWEALLRQVGDHFERFRLARLASYCSEHAIAPEQLDEAVCDAFGAALLESLIERPKQVHREACLAWNRALETVPGWPPILLRLPQNRRTYALPVTAYPASFATELQAYLDHRAGHDLFAATARKPASPLTLKDNRLQLLQLAAALVHTGRDPATLTGLADLLEIEAAKTALTFLWQRKNQQKTGQLHRFALLLIKLAKHWVKVPPEQLEALRQLRKLLTPESTGMTARNRALLRVFDDPANVAQLIQLPETLVRRHAGAAWVSYDAALQVQSALVIAILLVAPLRVKNLAGLTLDRHIVRARRGVRAVRHLVVPAHEVKNASPLEFELPEPVQRLLDLYVTRYRPVLAQAPPSCLFPARQGGAKPPAQLGAQIQRLIRQETGFKLNIHLFRHLAAKLFLRAHPGEYETVRLLLGHKSLLTTVRSYCGLEQADAMRRYDQVLKRYRTGDQAAGDEDLADVA
jgi:integrase